MDPGRLPVSEGLGRPSVAAAWPSRVQLEDRELLASFNCLRG